MLQQQKFDRLEMLLITLKYFRCRKQNEKKMRRSCWQRKLAQVISSNYLLCNFFSPFFLQLTQKKKYSNCSQLTGNWQWSESYYAKYQRPHLITVNKEGRGGENIEFLGVFRGGENIGLFDPKWKPKIIICKQIMIPSKLSI